MSIIEKIKNQQGSNGVLGWPVAVRDRIHYPSPSENIVTDANVGVTFLWTERQDVVPKLEKEGLAIAANFYTPAGLQGMVRNILGNPYIQKVVMLGNEYSSKKEGSSSELTSANAIRSFFRGNINDDRTLEGFGNAVRFDPNIPLDEIMRIQKNVELVDLNTSMEGASLEDKVKRANEIISSTRGMSPFAEPQTFDYEKLGGSFPYEGGPLIVHGETIPEAWIKMIKSIDRFGVLNLMNAGTDRQVKEINNMGVVVHNSQSEDLSLNPFLTPMTPEIIKSYQEEILSPILPPGKAYTYGNKLRAYLIPYGKDITDLLNNPKIDFEFGRENAGNHLNFLPDGSCEIDQIGEIIDTLKKDPYSKSAIAMTWHPADELMRKHKSSPCLAYVQPLVQGDKLNLTALFRSHDMVQGWPTNAYGCAALQREIAKGAGVEPGLMTIFSGSAQIYNNYVQQVKSMLDKFGSSVGFCSDRRGNFLIRTSGGNIVATLTHPDTGVELEEYSGNTAKKICDAISSKTELTTSHAFYLGREFDKAEDAIKFGRKYIQE